MPDRRNLYFDSKNAGTHGDVWSCIRSHSSDGICYAVVRKDGLGKHDYVDVTCPDGFVTYRLSRVKK